MKHSFTLSCPNCGYQYLPSEIYIPKNFFGNPDIIIRDESGNIEGITGTDMNLEETYTCDRCNKEFKISSKISFSTSSVEDFNCEYVTKIKKTNLFLDES